MRLQFTVITVVHQEASSADMARVCASMAKELSASPTVYGGLQELRRYPVWMLGNEPYEKRQPGEVVSPGGVHDLPVMKGEVFKGFPSLKMTQ